MKTPPGAVLNSTTRYATIDAWRGAACLAVVAYHVLGSSMHQPLWAPLEPLRAVARHGWLGLHVFFVLSGYCVFERVRSALRQEERPAAFIVDRALRIYPTYSIALFAAVAMNVLASPLNGTSLSRSIPLDGSFWLGNVTLLHVFLGEVPYLIVTWTLACELAFYAVSAGLLALARGRLGIGGAFVSGGLLCALAFWATPAGWKLPLALWPDFFAGICVSVALGGSRGRALVVLGVLTVAAWLPLQPYATEARQCAMIFAWVLVGLHRWDAALAQNPIVRALTWVGVFSYSLYLLHVPLAGRIVNLGFRMVEITSPWFGVFLSCGAASALAGSWLFWRVVERRCEQWRQSRRRTHLVTSDTPFAAAKGRAIAPDFPA